MADLRSGPESDNVPTTALSADSTPVDPWASTAPVSPTAPLLMEAELAPPRKRRWLVPVAAATAVLAVIVFAAVAFWPTGKGPRAPLGFHPVTEVGQVTFTPDAEPALARITDERLYAAAVVDDRLEVVARDLASETELWRTAVTGSSRHRWESIIANSTAVMLAAGPRSYGDPRLLVVLDPGTGQERWRREFSREVSVFLREGALGLVDREEHRLTGLDPLSGRVVWEVDYSFDEPARSPAVVSVYTEADYTGASWFDGIPAHRYGKGMVVVNADRSAQLVDLTTGEPVWQHRNVADPTDLLFAQDDWLYVAEHSEGYRVLAYDLTTSGGQPRTLYPVEDTTRHPITPPQPCGQKRICLLDQSSFDSATIELVAIDADGKGQVWRRPVPEADQLMAIGDTVVVSGGTPMVVGFDRDGEVVFEQATGAAARINEGNLLVFGDEPWSSFGDMSLLGYAVEDHRLVALHTVRGIVATACSWGAATGEGYLACPTREAVTIWRFASD